MVRHAQAVEHESAHGLEAGSTGLGGQAFADLDGVGEVCRLGDQPAGNGDGAGANSGCRTKNDLIASDHIKLTPDFLCQCIFNSIDYINVDVYCKNLVQLGVNK